MLAVRGQLCQGTQPTSLCPLHAWPAHARASRCVAPPFYPADRHALLFTLRMVESLPYQGSTRDDEGTRVQVEENADGSVTTTTTTSGTSASGDHYYNYQVEVDYPSRSARLGSSGSSSSSSSSSDSEGSDGRSGVHAQVQSAYDAHVEERMRMLDQQEQEGRLSPAKADKLRTFLGSQVRVWVHTLLHEGVGPRT